MALDTNSTAVKNTVEAYKLSEEIKDKQSSSIKVEYSNEVDEKIYGRSNRRIEPDDELKTTRDAYAKSKEIRDSLANSFTEEYSNDIDKRLYGIDWRRTEPDSDLDTISSVYDASQYLKEMYAKAINDPELKAKMLEGIDTYLNVAERITADGKTKQYTRYLNDYLDLGGEKIDLSRGISALSTSSVKRYNYRRGSDNVKEQGVDVPVLDTDWACSKFMTGSKNLHPLDAANRFFSWADIKSADASLGNHSVINPLPQFTRYADIRRTTSAEINKDQMHGTKYFATGLGMGRYYSEAIDDNTQDIFLQFGVPEFNSMLRFLMNASSYEDTYVAMHGRYPIELGIARAASTYIAARIYPWKAMIIWAGKTIWKFITGFNQVEYYYLNPTMHNYWGTVNSIVTSMAVELGIFVPSPEFTDSKTEYDGKEMGLKIGWDEEDMDALKAVLPGIWGPKTKYIDVYAIAARHQILANRQKKKMSDMYETVSDEAIASLIGAVLSNNDNLDPEKLKTIQDRQSDGYIENPTSWLDHVANYKNSLAQGDGTLLNPFAQLAKIPDGMVSFANFLKVVCGVSDKSGVRSKDGNNTVQVFTEKGQTGNAFTDKKYSTYTSTGGSYTDVINHAMNEGVPPGSEQRITATGRRAYSGFDSNLDKAAADIDVAEKLTSGSSEGASEDEKALEKKALQIIDKLEKWANGDGSLKKVFGGFDNAMDQAAQVMTAVQMDGGLFLGLRVNPTRGVSDSFSNSYSPIQTGEFIKSGTGAVRDMRFNLSGGNLLPGMDDVLSVVKNIAIGTLDGMTFGLTSVIASVLQGAYIDMPDKWDDSSCNLGSVSYSIRLTAPYGNAISQLQNIYIPLACLLAGVLPMQTGKSSHTSPFLCSLFSKGIQDVELGMITELSIERATSNLPYNRWRQPLAIDVSFTVTDFSKVVSAPINRSIWQAILQDGISGMMGQLTTETKLDDYIGILCGRDLSSSRFEMPKISRRLRKALLRSTQTFTNMNAVAFGMGEWTNLLFAILGGKDGDTQVKNINRNRTASQG